MGDATRNIFQTSHSSDKMVSEHANRFAKTWEVLRGRTDYRIFVDEKHLQNEISVCRGLHNYIMDACSRI
jgi:hypothetical protein